MVNKVNGNDYYDYSKLKMPDAADRTGNGEQFSLAYQRAQEESEEKDEKDKEAIDISGLDMQRTVLQDGVRLELSGRGKSDVKRESLQQSQSAGPGLFDTIKTWFTAFVQSVREFAYKIWNDQTLQEDTTLQEGVSVQDETAESNEPERLSEEYLALKKLEGLQNPEAAAGERLASEAKREDEIQKLLRSGDMEQVLSLVTENGRKTIAKNSTLLTYYDRTGKITPLSASDQERILHGDRNTRKL
ncbi:MAG: hypothetical protein J1F42_05270 [Lachnospiraceae bacterium]|nr:hypothetical protein [Lachnospiraceae bacterium]